MLPGTITAAYMVGRGSGFGKGGIVSGASFVLRLLKGERVGGKGQVSVGV